MRGRLARGIGAVAFLAAFALPSSAFAQSNATSVENEIAAPSAGISLGTSYLETTYPAGNTVIAQTFNSPIGLPPDRQFRIYTCVMAHVELIVPRSNCNLKAVDTNPESGWTSHATTPISVQVQRPPALNTGYATHHTYVDRLDAGVWRRVADSWPAGGIAATSLPLFAVGATSGPLPDLQGVNLDPEIEPEVLTPRHGGKNSGYPDSFCVGTESLGNQNPLPPGVTTNDLGSPPLPAYYEVGQPTANLPLKGVMLTIHGGGWYSHGRGKVQGYRGEANYWRGQGWRTVNVTYRPCGDAIGDMTLFFDRIKQTYPGAGRVCAAGESAGGHLATLLAAWRDLDCAINYSGPTDPTTIHTQMPPVGEDNNLARGVHNLAVAAFGEEALTYFSPGRLAAQIADREVHIFSAPEAEDPFIPEAQHSDLVNAVNGHGGAATLLTPGLAPTASCPKGSPDEWVHTCITPAERARLRTALQSFIATVPVP